MQYSLRQLMAFTTAVAFVFWLVGAAGLPATIFLAATVLSHLLIAQRNYDTLLSGAFAAAIIHGASGVLLLAVGAIKRPEWVTLLHIIPGAYLGAAYAVWRQAKVLAQFDAPMGPNSDA